MVTPARSIRFDINAYFQQLKEQRSPLQETYFLKKDTSARTKTTDDQTQRDAISQKFS